jgi:hypothetical protein
MIFCIAALDADDVMIDVHKAKSEGQVNYVKLYTLMPSRGQYQFSGGEEVRA